MYTRFAPALRKQLLPLCVAVACSGSAWAVCTPPSPMSTAGGAVSCTGVSAGPYEIRAQNVTFSNDGTLSQTGSSVGVVYAVQNLASGFQGSNDGTIEWINAIYGSGGTGSRAVINMGFVGGNNFTNTAFLNNGRITASITTALSADRAIKGIAAYTTRAPGTIALTNSASGVIELNDSASTAAGTWTEGMSSRAYGDSAVRNNGTVRITSNTGISALNNTTDNGVNLIHNTGSVLISSPSISKDVTALNVTMTAGTTSAAIVNEGLVQLSGGTAFGAKRGAIKIDGISTAAQVVTVNNSTTGQIEVVDYSRAILIDGNASTLTGAAITNVGIIEGDIFTLGGTDSYTQTAGSFAGAAEFGAGSDTVLISGGDVSAASLFDGGDDDDSLTTDGVDMRVYSAGVNDPAKGSQLLNWETVVAQNGGKLRLTDDLITPGGQVRVEGGGSMLDASLKEADTTAVDADLVNNGGVITLQQPAASPQERLKTHAFTANGGELWLDTTLDDASASISDVLQADSVIAGGAPTAIRIKPTTASMGAQTTGKGIQVVQIMNGAASSAPAAFTLAAPVWHNGYSYDLVRDDTDGNWYLQSHAASNPNELTPVPTLEPWGLLLLSGLLVGLTRRRRG